MKIQRDIHGRYHDSRGRFTKVELSVEELESLLDEVRLNQVNEQTYERANEEFIIEEKYGYDDVFANLAAGVFCLVGAAMLILVWG